MRRGAVATTGNVFRDLGFSVAEAENLKLRSTLMTELCLLIEGRELTQVEAAALFGVSQPRVSDLVRGKIDRFSVDTLVSMLGAAGASVSLSVRSAREGRSATTPRSRRRPLRSRRPARG